MKGTYANLNQEVPNVIAHLGGIPVVREESLDRDADLIAKKSESANGRWTEENSRRQVGEVFGEDAAQRLEDEVGVLVGRTSGIQRDLDVRLDAVEELADGVAEVAQANERHLVVVGDHADHVREDLHEEALVEGLPRLHRDGRVAQTVEDLDHQLAA